MQLTTGMLGGSGDPKALNGVGANLHELRASENTGRVFSDDTTKSDEAQCAVELGDKKRSARNVKLCGLAER